MAEVRFFTPHSDLRPLGQGLHFSLAAARKEAKQLSLGE